MSNEYFDILDMIKTKRYLSQPLDNIHSFYNNINLERIFAMTKKNKDMTPNKEIYTQIKARMNKLISYLKDEGLIEKLLRSEAN